MLKEYRIESVYHYTIGIEQGDEQENTFFMHKKREKGYHIDYVYGSSRFCGALTKFEIGKYDDWIRHSDHCPVIGDFDSLKLVL